MVDFLRRVNKYCLFLLIFSATFEYWNPFHVSDSLSVARITTIIYFISSIPFLRQNLIYFKVKRYIIPLLLFILAGIVSSSLNDKYVIHFSEVINSRVIQLILLMILIISHVSTDKKVLRGSLISFVVSMCTLASLNLFFGVGENFMHNRHFIFGENPNLTGMKASLAILVITANLINKKYSIWRLIFSCLLALPIINLLIVSGSRGALLSLLVGLIVMMVLLKISWLKKVILFFIGVCFSIYLVAFILEHNKDFGQRIENSIAKGETAGRIHLWESAYRMIEDNYFLGVGSSGLMPEMQRYSGKRNTVPHNIFLEVWLTSGFLGFFFFMVFLFRLWGSLYKEYKLTGNVLNLIIFLVILFNMSKSGGSIGFIFAWIFFGLLIASTLINKRENQKYLNENISNIQ